MGEQLQIDSQLQLVEAIKTNDHSVLKQLYQDNYKKVEIYILQNSGSMPQAKDTYQEAYLAMYQNIKADKFTPTNETALQGYLYQIAKNKWRDFLRSSRYKKTTSIADNFQLANEDSEYDSLDQHKESDEQMGMAMNAFSKLGEACKELLKKFYFDKSSMKEIASELNLNEASTRNKKYRCIQKLKELAFTPN